jgi:hypothetical protein
MPNKTSTKKPAQKKPAQRKIVENPKAAESAATPRPKRERRTKEGMSGLDAAAKVLAESGEPMRCGDIATAIIERGLWATKGKTPGATLNAAIIREIRDKGKESRFRRAGRGLFAAAGKEN